MCLCSYFITVNNNKKSIFTALTFERFSSNHYCFASSYPTWCMVVFEYDSFAFARDPKVDRYATQRNGPPGLLVSEQSSPTPLPEPCLLHLRLHYLTLYLQLSIPYHVRLPCPCLLYKKKVHPDPFIHLRLQFLSWIFC